jgi:hypothetical protein
MDEQATAGAANGPWLQYLQSIHDLQQQSLRQHQHLWNEYLQSLQSSRAETRDDVTEAYRTYILDVQAALGSQAEQGEAVSAWQKYTDALKELQSAAEREAVHAGGDAQHSAGGADGPAKSVWLDPEHTHRISEAYAAFTDAQRKWSSAVYERLTEANQKYLASLSGTMTQGDAASDAKAAYERYVQGVAGTYRSTVESADASAAAAAEKAAKKRSK